MIPLCCSSTTESGFVVGPGLSSCRYLWWILELLRHSQCTANPLNPPTPLTRGEDKKGIFSLFFPLLSEGFRGTLEPSRRSELLVNVYLLSLIHYNRNQNSELPTYQTTEDTSILLLFLPHLYQH